LGFNQIGKLLLRTVAAQLSNHNDETWLMTHHMPSRTHFLEYEIKHENLSISNNLEIFFQQPDVSIITFPVDISGES
jgi:hypothetical protein